MWISFLGSRVACFQSFMQGCSKMLATWRMVKPCNDRITLSFRLYWGRRSPLSTGLATLAHLGSSMFEVIWVAFLSRCSDSFERQTCNIPDPGWFHNCQQQGFCWPPPTGKVLAGRSFAPWKNWVLKIASCKHYQEDDQHAPRIFQNIAVIPHKAVAEVSKIGDL